VEWALAIAGILFKSFALSRLKAARFAVASALVYLFQGWFGVFATRLLANAIGWHGVLWLAAAVWLTRWASCSSRLIAYATFMQRGTCLCWWEVLRTIARCCSTWFQPAHDRRNPSAPSAGLVK